MTTYYITNYGNDNNDGLSLNAPFRTFFKINELKTHYNKFYVDGYFTDFYTIDSTYIRYMYGLNNSKIDGQNSYKTATIQSELHDFEIFNFDTMCAYNTRTMLNCYFHDINKLYTVTTTGSSKFSYCIFNNINTATYSAATLYTNNTFFNCNTVYVGNYNNTKLNNIFCNCNIRVFNKIKFWNNLFINCSFWFYGGELGNDETTYSYPAGTSGDEKLQSLRNRMTAVYGNDTVDYISNCVYYTGSYNDIFVDADNENFTLVPGCVAESMSHIDGNFIGAKSSAISSNIINSTINNISTSGYIIDQSQDAYYESEIIDLGYVKCIRSFNIIEKLSPYNGLKINNDTDLGEFISQGTNGLIDNNTYAVISNNIELNNINNDYYTTWNTFIANAETPVEGISGDGLHFSEKCFEYGTYGTCGTNAQFIVHEYDLCGTNAVVQTVLIDNYSKKIKIKVSKTDSTLTNSVELLMNLSSEPTVNVNILGEPILGNADANFDANNAVSLYARYIKFIIDIKSNSLAIR